MALNQAWVQLGLYGCKMKCNTDNQLYLLRQTNDNNQYLNNINIISIMGAIRICHDPGFLRGSCSGSSLRQRQRKRLPLPHLLSRAEQSNKKRAFVCFYAICCYLSHQPLTAIIINVHQRPIVWSSICSMTSEDVQSLYSDLSESRLQKSRCKI